MAKNKKLYLKSYLLQQSKISRLREMISINPDMKEEYEKQIKELNPRRNRYILIIGVRMLCS